MLAGLKGARLLALDSGNALFRNAGVATEADRLRAHFILEVMGRQGVKAMAVGPRDLSAGAEFLHHEATLSRVKVLSANLKRAGALVFDDAVMLDAGGLKVAVVGVSAPGPIAPNAPDLVAGPTEAAVRATVAKLGKRDLTILLAATSYGDAMQLAGALKGQVDFIFQSGEFRGTQPPQRIDETNVFLFASGQRGQALGKLTVDLGSGKGSFVDLSSTERDRQQLQFVTSQVATLDQRIAAARDKTAVSELKKVRLQMKARQETLKESIEGLVAQGARTLKLDWVVLGSDVKDDAALKQEVLKYEPSFAGAH